MPIYLRYATAGQEIPLGNFVDSADGDTEKTSLSIATSDVYLWKAGATSMVPANSSGATHMSKGVYYCVLDATDTNTLGSLVAYCHVSGALVTRTECTVLPINVYDSFIAGTDSIDASIVALAAASIDEASFASDTAKHQGKLWMFKDTVAPSDIYSCAWFENGEVVLSGVTSPTLQVYNTVSGSDLIAQTGMSESGSNGTFYYVETSALAVAGTSYMAKITAVVNGVTSEWVQPVGRDGT